MKGLIADFNRIKILVRTNLGSTDKHLFFCYSYLSLADS